MFSNILSSMKLAMGGYLSKEASEMKVEAPFDVKDIIIVDNTSSITTSKDAVIYCRVSTPQQSLEAQEYACKVYCERKGYNVINVIREVGSAYKGNKQRKLKQFINDSEDINLIVYKLDRFSRCSGQCDSFIDEMANKRINLECITDPINLSSSLGKLKFREAILKAQFESDQISERVNSYHRYRVANNIKIHRPTYGYKLSDDKKAILRINEEQEVIKFIIGNNKMKRNSQELTDSMFKLLTKLDMPQDHFVRIEIQNDTDEMIVNARNIADLLNEYNIKKRGLPWTMAKVNGVFKRSLDLSKLSI